MNKRLTCGVGLSCLLALGLVVWSATPGVGQSQQSIPTRLSALEAQVSTLGLRVETLMQQVNGQGQQIETLIQQMTGQAQHLALLQTQVDGIANPAVPFGITVNCDVGQTVTVALAQAALHTGPVDITINGVCHEAVLLRRSNTTLWGGTPGSGLNPGTDSGSALEVAGAWNVGIHDLTLTGAGEGLTVADSQVTLYSSSIVGNRASGIGVANSSLSVRAGNTIDGNGYVGIILWSHAALSVDGSTITNNGNSGIRASNGSFVGVHATRIAGNLAAGIEVYFNGTLALSDGAVLEHNGTGIATSGMASVLLGDGVTIQENHGDGLHMADISVAIAWGDPLIQNNQGWGVSCGALPAVAQIGTSTFGTVRGNALGEVNCPRPQ